MNLSKRSVLVTGASRGLGRATAIAFAKAGAGVIFLNYLNDKDKADETASLVGECGATAVVIEADIADPVAVNAMSDLVREKLNGKALDVLINNAAIITRPGGWDEQTDEDLQRTLMVDLAGAMHCTRAFAPGMQTAGGGCIVNIASNNGIAGTAAIASYSASKAGIIQYTQNMAVALAPKVRVNAVAPGVCDTEMTTSAGEDLVKMLIDSAPLKRLGRPEEIADAVLFVVRNEFMTGSTVVVDGGITLPNS